ncbi:MAG: hypothetical protein MZV49_05335, partial [Rhodopseudomonas palustris]|nr:hypothetical protein [Rhodopseudomonas palustris]
MDVFASETDVVTRMALTLTDGSRVLGISRIASLKVDWQGRELNLNPALLKQIQLLHGTAKTRVNFV